MPELEITTTNPTPGAFALVDRSTGTAAAILADRADWPGVLRAAKDLVADVNRVTGISPQLVHDPASAGRTAIILGTIGKGPLIDRLIRDHKIDVSTIAGQWESFLIEVVPNPLPGIDSALVICGSDKRGTIYGIYHISEQIGVSPWYWWANVPPKHHDRLFIQPGRLIQGPPGVKYRGIFLNDEHPDLTRWVQATYGGVKGLEAQGVANYGREFYARIFELMLRIRANYLWPAMWNNAFNEDDPENPRLADEYGIVMGTTHQEPMLRAQKEWDRGPGRQHGHWNWTNETQRPILQQFWREGVRRNKHFESIITLGLRAENDSGAPLGKDLTAQVIDLQRNILAEEINPDLTKVPQLWCLYKEVQGYYADGLRVPDDVTLLWAEDNWGNLRRVPSPDEQGRSGGAGIYYHFDYHGGPRNYQWVNTSPIAKVWDQMTLAKQYGADRIWIVNVGHFKGYEFPMEFFMRLAWDPSRFTSESMDQYTRDWAARQFGPDHATEIADLISTCTKFNGRRKPELLEPSTYSLVHHQEFETVVADYEALAARAQAVYDQLPAETRDAFYDLVQFPIKASAQLNAMYLAAAKNALYAKQGRASANDYAALTRALFQADQDLMDHYNHRFAGGKWNHFMDQIHIGYTSWNEPPQNNLDTVPFTELPIPEPPAMGIAIEGSTSAWPRSGAGEPVLPQFDIYNQQRYYIDVFNKGKTPFTFSALANAPWIQIADQLPDSTTRHSVPSPLGEGRVGVAHRASTSATSSHYAGQVAKDLRLWVTIDWPKAPAGASTAQLTFSGPGATVAVQLSIFNPTHPSRDSIQGFVEAAGYISIEAEHYSANLPSGPSRWIRIPGYGHTLSAMRADGPPYIQATPGKDSPCLQYQLHLFTAGQVEVESILGATLNFIPGRPLRYAISFDDQPPQTLTIVPPDLNVGGREWGEIVKNNCHRIKSTHTIAAPGQHTLKLWMIDPAVAVQKLLLNTGGLKPTYLGPPETFHR